MHMQKPELQLIARPRAAQFALHVLIDIEKHVKSLNEAHAPPPPPSKPPPSGGPHNPIPMHHGSPSAQPTLPSQLVSTRSKQSAS
jgi:hypothetical protein